VCVCGHVGGRKIWTASDFAHAPILRVLFRTRAGPIRAGRVRLCTRGLTACADTDTQRPIRAIARPFVHTGRPGVCKVGREAGHTALYLSVCAHGTPRRVQIRTRRGRFGRSRVRLCTRDAQACAKSDDASGGLSGACSTQEQELRRGRLVHALPDESVGAHRHRTSKTPDPGNDPHAKTTGPFVGRIAFEGADS